MYSGDYIAEINHNICLPQYQKIKTFELYWKLWQPKRHDFTILSKQLSLNKFFDPSTPSMRKGHNGENGKRMGQAGAELCHHLYKDLLK